jgi:hypothetical protein
LADKNEILSVVLFGSGMVILLIMGMLPSGQLLFNVIALIFSIICVSVSVLMFASKDLFYMFEPIMKMKNKVAVINSEEPYYMSPNGASVLVRTDTGVYATSFVKIPVYSSSTNMTDEEKFNFSGLFARLVGLSKDPMRISSQLYMINKDEYISRINAKLNEVQERYNTLQNDKSAQKSALDRAKGEVTMWHNLLDNVSRANSLSLSAYASITVIGGTEDEAVNLASLKADEIAVAISTTLGVMATVASGNEIRVFIEPDYLLPPGTVGGMMKSKALQSNT